MSNLSKWELTLKKKGFRLIAGVDEAGRGALAGPLVAASLILPLDLKINGVKDSKKLTPERREKLYDEIVRNAVDWSVAVVEVEEIDNLGLQQANLLALERAVEGLKKNPEFILVDHYRLDFPNSLSITKGDTLVFVISAASIVAKVERDRLMKQYHQEFPVYQWDKNKGYGTLEHRKLIKIYGPCRLHRRCFLNSNIFRETLEGF